MITSAILWSIWKLRNELCFQRVEKYGYSLLQNYWTASELDSSVSKRKEGFIGWVLEESEDGGKYGSMATRHPQERSAKFFRSVIEDAPEDACLAPGKIPLNTPSLPWWKVLNEDFLQM
jgi:hypothetical protein